MTLTASEYRKISIIWNNSLKKYSIAAGEKVHLACSLTVGVFLVAILLISKQLCSIGGCTEVTVAYCSYSSD